MPVTEVTDTEPVKDTKKYIDFGERKVKGKQIEVHADNRESDTSDSIMNNLDDYLQDVNATVQKNSTAINTHLQGENLVKDYSWIQDFKPSEEYKAGDIFKANVSRNSTSDNDLKERLIWVRVDLKPNEIGSTNDLVDAERNNKIYIGPCTHDIDTTKKGYAFDMILEDMKKNLSMGKIEGDEFHLMVLDEDPFRTYKLDNSPYGDQRITFCYNYQYMMTHLPYLKNYIGLPIVIEDGRICVFKAANFIDFNADEIKNWEKKNWGSSDRWEKFFTIDDDTLKKLNCKEGDIISFSSAETFPNGLFRIMTDVQVGDVIVLSGETDTSETDSSVKEDRYRDFEIRRKLNSTSEASTALRMVVVGSDDQYQTISEPIYDGSYHYDDITADRFAYFFQKYLNLRKIMTNSEKTKYQENPHEYCPFSELLSKEWRELPPLFPKYSSFMSYSNIINDKCYYPTSLIEYHNYYLLPTREISLPDFKNNDVNYIERYRHPYYFIHPDELPDGIEPSWKESDTNQIYFGSHTHQNAPKILQAVESHLIKENGLFSAFSQILNEYREASQMVATNKTRWYDASTPLYEALYNFANSVDSTIYKYGQAGIFVNPAAWEHAENLHLFKSGNIINDILNVLSYYNNAIFPSLTPTSVDGSLVYTHNDWPIGSNIGLLDAQLKKVTDQLNAIPATLNPSTDGTIVKKDSTVAENLMLLDAQINNLKQEVEQLKNKQ